MKEVLVIFLVILIHGNDGGLYVQGPSKPVLENAEVILECMSTDPGVDLSQVHLRKLTNQGRWRFLLPDRSDTNYQPLHRTTIPSMMPFWSGVYACVSNNASTPDNSSQALTLNMFLPGGERESLDVDTTSLPAENRTNTFSVMKSPTIHPQGRGSQLLGSLRRLSILEVLPGEDVVMDCSMRGHHGRRPHFYWSKEGEDWMLDSPQLTLRSVQAGDGGLYRCTATDPVERSLSSSQIISIDVLPEGSSWYRTTNGCVLLMTAVAASLLVLMLTMSVFLFRTAQRAKQAKGPIDDHSQKKPIYKGSAESLPASLSGDTQPLV
ncbi:uncharacterized protein si:ch211-79k12.1 [Gadus macrocephalus]|uniref:uncharacterized protein si:ch211-79k12.1 n=1 Tax=Gadus macrocephalus TaxID=80720 RepID=UPI0028CB3655|nr:uncharacterized protein si:ch211-79k12.1 [Gadus macrocephalus]